MFVIDRPGQRRLNVPGVGEVSDHLEVAKIHSDNPKYADTSIYVVPDHHLQHQDAKTDTNQTDCDIEEARGRAGRAGRLLRKKDVDCLQKIKDALRESKMPAEDIDGYISSYMPYLAEEGAEGKKRLDAIKSVYNHSIASSGPFSQQIDFNDLDGGCLIPLPIKSNNLTQEKIDMMRHGKTYVYRAGREVKTYKGNVVAEVKREVDELKSAAEASRNQSEINKASEISCRFEKYQPSGDEMIEISYIYGPNRSGKTYYAAKYAKEWSDTFKDWPIYLFSRRDKDKVLDDLDNLERVEICPELAENPLSMSDFCCSLVIFDDTDTIPDQKVCKAIQKLRDDIMETGRQKMIYVINTSHLGMNWKPTRTVLNEANSYTLFPRKGNYEHNFNILKDKLGLKRDTIRAIIDRTGSCGPNASLGYRGKWGWVTVYKDSPQYVIYENGIALLS
jgi:hypothetical protein